MPQSMRVPKFIHLEVTAECRAECPQCYMRGRSFSAREMDFELCCTIIAEAAVMGIEYILITGGEPLEYKYLTECVGLMSLSGIKSMISTSGIGLTEETSSGLHFAGLCEACVSMNGSTPEIHNLSRTNYGAAVNALKLFKSAGIRTRVNWVARRDNLRDFPELAGLCGELGAESVDVLACKHGEINQFLNPEEVRILAGMISKLGTEFVNIEPCYEKLNNILMRPRPAFGSKCWGGRVFFDVLADGSKTVCRHVGGEIREQTKNMTLRQFWQSAGSDAGNVRVCQLER